MLYQPTPAEIEAVVRRGTEKHPPLAGRWARAAALLAAVNQHLSWDGAAWRCYSQSNGRDAYPLDLHSCGCYDHQVAGATVKGVPYCKHKLALLGYRQILGLQIGARALGTYGGCADLERLRSRPNAGLLFSQNGAPAHVLYVADGRDRIPTRLCAVRFAPFGNVPADAADVFVCATWLAQAAALAPVYEPAPAGWDAAPAAEWQPQMSRSEFQRWLATGALPALQE